MDNPPASQYKLPKEGEELDRLDIQHRMITLTMGGLYPLEFRGAFEKLMIHSEEPRILDVGCGTGIWSFEMARLYPQAQVVGVDLTPVGASLFPSNFSFRSLDLAGGLPPEYKAKFDIIHCRVVTQHVSDPQGLVDSMAECLKPGGFLLIVDAENSGCFDENQKLLEPFIYDPSTSDTENIENNEGRSWLSGWLYAVLLALQSPRYELASVLIRRSKGLEELKIVPIRMPIKWEGVGLENGKEIGELMLKNWIGVLKFDDLVARQSGAPPRVIEHWRNAVMQEITTQRRFMNWRCTIASKYPIDQIRALIRI